MLWLDFIIMCCLNGSDYIAKCIAYSDTIFIGRVVENACNGETCRPFLDLDSNLVCVITKVFFSFFFFSFYVIRLGKHKGLCVLYIGRTSLFRHGIITFAQSLI